jgi:hypothetical protein
MKQILLFFVMPLMALGQNKLIIHMKVSSGFLPILYLLS